MNSTDRSASAPTTKHWYQRIGPGLITACVVIGPGSILTSSKIGAGNGYAMSWVVAAAVIFMLTFMSLGAKLGVVASSSAGDLVTQRAGRWLAVLIGIGVFFISAAYQFGNNLGVDSAFRVFLPARGSGNYHYLFDYIVVAFNVLSIAFLFLFRNLYKAVERLMMAFVALMLISFALNLAFAKPNLVELVAGFVPSLPKAAELADATLWAKLKGAFTNVTLIGLVGTTFVITAAYFQTYLVRQKGWGQEDLKDGMADARVGSIIMALITLMIMSTSAAVLRGTELSSVEQVANQLKPLFGEFGQLLFCLGLFSAAYSSFLVNSMIGGFILSDGLGLGSRPTDLWPKVLTAAVLLTGMCVALYVLTMLEQGQRPVALIVGAQAATVIAAPLMAGVLLWLTNRRDIMGDQRNGPVANLLGIIGFLVLLLMAWSLATEKVWPEVQKWLGWGIA